MIFTSHDLSVILFDEHSRTLADAHIRVSLRVVTVRHVVSLITHPALSKCVTSVHVYVCVPRADAVRTDDRLA